MLTHDYRPVRFEDIIGQPSPVKLMQSVVLSPAQSPRTYIFQGERGLGKTSLSRVFARALLCENRQNGDSCLSCESCLTFSDYGSGYQEYDSTQVGNVQFVRGLKDRLYYVENSRPYLVVVFDEVQAASPQAQNALLKLLEEGPKRIFFVLCTTDSDKIIDTIKSRCVSLSFSRVLDNDLSMFLHKVCEKEKIPDADEIVEKLVSFSFGHVRDALMQLDLYKQLGDKEKFLKLLHLPEKEIIDLFISIKKQDKDAFTNSMNNLLASPLAYLRKSFELFVLNAARTFSGHPVVAFSELYAEINLIYGQQIFEVLHILSQDWVYNCFKSDLSFQAFLWYLYTALTKGKKREESEVSARFRK